MIRVLRLYLIVLLYHHVSQAGEKLYVFYPTVIRTQEVQAEMQSVFGEVEVTVFGRFKDFSEQLKLEPPDALLAKTEFVQSLGEYKVAVKGLRKGKEKADYVVMSIKKPLVPDSLSAETVLGVIDMLGRKGTNEWVEKIFPNKPRIRRVTKVEDLLPLIRFNLAEGILIEDVFVDYFKNTSQLELAITPLLEISGIIALGVKYEANKQKYIGLLKKADKTVKSFFWVDKWK